MALLLLAANATVTIAHSRSANLRAEVGRADVVIAAVGVPKLIQGNWLAPGAIVVDVGIHRCEDGSLCGDVDFANAIGRAGAITPVPGGVGPMTIATLMANTARAAGARR
jgi:methylenetetrahydrofolate dehydrogenase (NADP+) / methenyltetrahydrofolate cyclohydrolase